MQVTELESTGLKKSFKIVVDAAQIESQMEAELKIAGERVKIPGFRPGYIPMKVLRQRYGKSVQQEVLKHVINHATTDVVSQRGLRPAVMPQINIENYEEGGDLAFTMALETFPEVPAIAFDDITLERQTFEIDDKEIDDALERIAERNPKMVPLEDGGKAKSGHVVTIDFKGSVDGVAFEGGAAQDFRLELGSGQFIAGFEDQLIGLKKGDEKTVEVTFPKEYHAKHLAGKEASFAVTVKDIQAKDIPPVDDELAKKIGFSDLRAFREVIRDRLIKEYDQIVRSHLKRQLFDELDEKVDFELPQSMVDLEFKTIWDNVQASKNNGEEDDDESDKSEDELKEEYLTIARRRVKLGLVLADIGSRNKLQVSREELSRAVMQQASGYPGQEQQIVEFYRKNPDRVEDLRGPILEEKAVDFVLERVKFNDRKLSVDELVKENEEDGVIKKKAAKSSKPKAEKTDKAEKTEKKTAAKPKKKKA